MEPDTGVAFLCGIGFTMSLFIGLLAFDDPAIQDKIKLGILSGSLIAGLSGFAACSGSRVARIYRVLRDRPPVRSIH